MKKVLFIMLIVGLLVALAVPVFADKGGATNDNAKWGQFHKNIEDLSSEIENVSDMVRPLQGEAANYGMNLGQFVKEIIKPYIEANF